MREEGRQRRRKEARKEGWKQGKKDGRKGMRICILRLEGTSIKVQTPRLHHTRWSPSLIIVCVCVSHLIKGLYIRNFLSLPSLFSCMNLPCAKVLARSLHHPEDATLASLATPPSPSGEECSDGNGLNHLSIILRFGRSDNCLTSLLLIRQLVSLTALSVENENLP